MITMRDSFLAKIEVQKLSLILLKKKSTTPPNKQLKVNEYLIENVSFKNDYNIAIRPVLQRQSKL